MRLLDVSLSFIALVVLAPVLLVVAVLVKITSPGPVLYRATRVGQHGRLFTLYKFRSMVVNADSVGPRVTGTGDARVTRVGRLLRTTKLDELPQLFNTLSGNMSLVGPRPEDPEYVTGYTAREREVLRVKPGITSPATVLHHDEEEMLTGPDWEERYRRDILPAKLQIELEYLERRTCRGDLKVLLQTASVILSRHVRFGSLGRGQWRT